jgi:hypothetical protein
VGKSNYICTWMYAETPAERGIYPQLGMDSATKTAHDVYWRCIVVFFETARRALRDKPDCRLVLFTNQASLPTVDGVDLKGYLRKLNVDIIIKDYTWRPAAKSRLWFNQYYIFDILSSLDSMLGTEDAVIIADCDCVFVRDPAQLFEIVRRDDVLLISVDETRGADDEINGLSRRMAMDVYQTLGNDRPDSPPAYFGGECYGLTRKTLTSVMALAPVVKLANDALAAAGQPYLSDEAHFYSFLMWKLGFSHPNGNSRVRRIWTSWKNNTTRASDLDLTMWHLPSEKTIGFRKIYDNLRSWPQSWSEAQNLAWLAGNMGVGRKSVRKFTAHLINSTRQHLMGMRLRAGKRHVDPGSNRLP